MREGAQAGLAELLAYRRRLNAEVAARTAQLRAYAGRTLRARAGEALERLRRELDALVRAAVEADPELRASSALLTSMPAVGSVLAATLLARLPEPGALDRRRVASPAGLAPFPPRPRRAARAPGRPRREGRGAPSPLHGDPRGRPAPDRPRRPRRRLRAAGEPGKVALVAGMRKLLTTLNALLRSGQPWKAAPDPA